MTSQLPLEIDCLAVKALQAGGEEFLFVDCRQTTEWEVVRLTGTTLIPIEEIQSRVQELEPHRERRIVVHCHHGGRSRMVVDWLRQRGFTSAQNMTGGIDAWAREIDPSLPRY